MTKVKSIYFFLLFALFIGGCDDGAQQAEQNSSLALDKQWEAFIENPTEEKAELLLKAAYKEDETSGGFRGSEWVELKITELQQKLAQRDKEGFKAAFILSEFLDGALAEELHIAIASTVVSEPKLYLEYAYQYKGRIGAPLLQIGWDLVDDDQGQVNTLEQRIKALQDVAVQDRALAIFRDKLIEDLKDEIKMLKKE